LSNTNENAIVRILQKKIRSKQGLHNVYQIKTKVLQCTKNFCEETKQGPCLVRENFWL
jgi:hypothetical protein